MGSRLVPSAFEKGCESSHGQLRVRAPGHGHTTLPVVLGKCTNDPLISSDPQTPLPNPAEHDVVHLEFSHYPAKALMLRVIKLLCLPSPKQDPKTRLSVEVAPGGLRSQLDLNYLAVLSSPLPSVVVLEDPQEDPCWQWTNQVLPARRP
jgi:hypothetical protein